MMEFSKLASVNVMGDSLFGTGLYGISAADVWVFQDLFSEFFSHPIMMICSSCILLNGGVHFQRGGVPSKGKMVRF